MLTHWRCATGPLGALAWMPKDGVEGSGLLMGWRMSLPVIERQGREGGDRINLNYWGA